MGAIKNLALECDEKQRDTLHHAQALHDVLQCVQVSTMPPQRREQVKAQLKALVQKASQLWGTIDKMP